jgi:hypothetical protein
MKQGDSNKMIQNMPGRYKMSSNQKNKKPVKNIVHFVGSIEETPVLKFSSTDQIPVLTIPCLLLFDKDNPVAINMKNFDKRVYAVATFEKAQQLEKEKLQTGDQIAVEGGIAVHKNPKTGKKSI